MVKLKLYNRWETKKKAQDDANSRRKSTLAPQYVQVRPIKQGKYNWGVYIGGKNSSIWLKK